MTLVRVCSAAASDYTEALCWYAERDSDVALQFEAEFEGVLAQISDAPDRQPTLDENHRYLPMRRFPFLIIYRCSGNSTTIVAVAHTSRSPDFWHSR
jgi:plasmid stabilization system protein ParE